MVQSHDIKDELGRLLRLTNSSEYIPPGKEELIDLRDRALKTYEGASFDVGIFHEYLLDNDRCSGVVDPEFANVVKQTEKTIKKPDIHRKYIEIRWGKEQAEHVFAKQQDSVRSKVISATAMFKLKVCAARLEFNDFVRLANHLLLARHIAVWGGNTQTFSIKTKPALQQEELLKIIDYHAAKGPAIEYHSKIIGSDVLDSEVFK